MGYEKHGPLGVNALKSCKTWNELESLKTHETCVFASDLRVRSETKMLMLVSKKSLWRHGTKCENMELPRDRLGTNRAFHETELPGDEPFTRWTLPEMGLPGNGPRFWRMGLPRDGLSMIRFLASRNLMTLGYFFYSKKCKRITHCFHFSEHNYGIHVFFSWPWVIAGLRLHII